MKSVVPQRAPRLCDASVRVCTSIERKPASSEKNMYGNARITYAAGEEAPGLLRRTSAGVPLKTLSSPTTITIGGTTNGMSARNAITGRSLGTFRCTEVDRRHEERETDHDRLEREQERDPERLPEVAVVDHPAVVVQRCSTCPSGSLLRLKSSVAKSGHQEVGGARAAARCTADGAMYRRDLTSPTSPHAAAAGCRCSIIPASTTNIPNAIACARCGLLSTLPV